MAIETPIGVCYSLPDKPGDSGKDNENREVNKA